MGGRIGLVNFMSSSSVLSSGSGYGVEDGVYLLGDIPLPLQGAREVDWEEGGEESDDFCLEELVRIEAGVGAYKEGDVDVSNEDMDGDEEDVAKSARQRIIVARAQLKAAKKEIAAAKAVEKAVLVRAGTLGGGLGVGAIQRERERGGNETKSRSRDRGGVLPSENTQTGVALQSMSGLHHTTIGHHVYHSSFSDEMLFRRGGGRRARSLSQRVAYLLTATPFGRIMDFLQIILSVVSSAMYVVGTYKYHTVSPPDEWLVAEVVFSSFFGVDYLLHLLAARSKIRFMVHPMSIVDLVTIVPVFLDLATLGGGSFDVAFLRIFRIFRLFRILRSYRMFLMAVNDVTRQFITLVFTVTTLLFVAAGFVQLFSSDKGFELQEGGPGRALPFHTAVWFVVVTVSTVGYGDMAPLTTVGRAGVMVLIATAVVVIPAQLSAMAALALELHSYDRAYTGREKHLLITGDLSADRIRSVARDLLHPENENVHEESERRGTFDIVLMGRDEPTRELVQLLKQSEFHGRLKYLRGNVLDDTDLFRASFETVTAAFILGPRVVDDISPSNSYDKRVVLSTLSFFSFNHQVSVFGQVVHPSLRSSLTGSQEGGPSKFYGVSLSELKSAIFAQSVRAPGFPALLANLLEAHRGEDVEETVFGSTDDSLAWIKQYVTGSYVQLFTIPVPSFLRYETFSRAAFKTYFRFEVLLIGLRVSGPSSTGNGGESRPSMDSSTRRTSDLDDLGSPSIGNPGDVVLNPGSGYMFEGEEMIVVMAESAEALANLVNNSEPHHHHKRPSELVETIDMFERGALRNQALNDVVTHNNSSSPTHGLPLQDASSLLHSSPPLPRNTGRRDDALRTGENVQGNGPTTFVVAPLDQQLELVKLLLASPDRGDDSIVLYGPKYPSDDDPLVSFLDHDQVQFFVGSPTHFQSMREAGIDGASTVILMKMGRGEDSLDNDAVMNDADVVLIHHALENQCRNPLRNVITELDVDSSTKFLPPHVADINFRAAYKMQPAYAAGSVFTSSILDAIICKAFQSETAVEVIRLLADPTAPPPELSDIAVRLFQIPLPPFFVGKVFGTFVAFLISELDIIPIGLYRQASVPVSPRPFVFTSPPEHTRLLGGDFVFVLATPNAISQLQGHE